MGWDNASWLYNDERFSERSPLPQKITHQVIGDGIVGPEIGQEGKDGIIREADVEVIMDLAMAKNLVTWLQGHIEFLEEQRNVQQGKGK